MNTAEGVPLVSIVSPTLNEALNIEEFVGRAWVAMADLPVSWEIVFADDSDDQTPEIVAKIAREGMPVRCVHRDQHERTDSISGAVRAALATVESPYAVVIDSDLQHPPEILPRMIRPIIDGDADFAVGSRYAQGGSADGLGSQYRRVASRGSAAFTAAVFPQFSPISDLASGLFAFSVPAFKQRDVPSTGFKVLTEALVRCDPGRVVDVPYAFESRFDGLSKARLRDGVRLALALLRLRASTRRLRKVTMASASDGS